MAFRTMFSGVLGTAAGLLTVVVLPAVVVFKGVSGALEDNPEGKDKFFSTEYHEHNAKQFAEGATFGLYEADEGVTAENTADIIYDGGKSAVESGGRFLDRLGERLSDDFEGTLPTGTKSAGNKDHCDDPKTIDASCLEEIPEPPM